MYYLQGAFFVIRAAIDNAGRTAAGCAKSSVYFWEIEDIYMPDWLVP